MTPSTTHPSTTHPGTNTPGTGGPDAGCAACPHPVADHDVIGLRFCSATLTGGLTRGCVCRSV